jgi:hypothetical protein
VSSAGDGLTLTLRGRRWRLERHRPDRRTRGDCDPPASPRKLVRIAARLGGRDELETLIHEMMHACHWDLCEDAVQETAADIAAALHRIGYRLPPAVK